MRFSYASTLASTFAFTPYDAAMNLILVILTKSHELSDHFLTLTLYNVPIQEIPPFRELFTWGANRRGCLGLGREDNQLYPLKVILPASVSQVSCGTNHTVALCDPLLM